MLNRTSHGAHAIMVAFPFQGHIAPYMNLAIKLASKGVVVTFVHLEFIHYMLAKSGDSNTKADIFSDARRSGLDIRYMLIDDGFPIEHNRDNHEYWESMLVNFEGRVGKLVEKLMDSDPHLATFLVTDTLFTWPAAIANKYNLLNVSFWTEPALVFSLVYHVELLQEKGHFPCKDHVEEEINYVPGVDSISTKDLMPYLKESAIGTLENKVAMKSFKEVKKADFILHNTVHELESDTISALNKNQPNYAIGPLNFCNDIATNLRTGTDCSGWLSSKPPGSVLYVSFGSIVETTKEDIEEIAYGLLLSEVNFIWVVRSETVISSLPSELSDDIKDKGLVVPWCDQTKVLSNSAVGGFLTHCGWNSILESIWSGVPMICYPLDYDQPTNRKLLVDNWRIGINLLDGTSVDRKEVARKIKSLMDSDMLKKEVKKRSEVLHNAYERDGSSEMNFNQFLNDLKAKLAEKSIKEYTSM